MSDRKEGEAETPTCAICSEGFNSGGRAPRMLACKHFFCHSCLVTMSKDKEAVECPECRRPTVLGKDRVFGECRASFASDRVVQAC